MDDRFADRYGSQAILNGKDDKKRSRPIIDLALDAYAKEFGTNAAKGGKINPAFRAAAMDHIKVSCWLGTTRPPVQYATLHMRSLGTRRLLEKS